MKGARILSLLLVLGLTVAIGGASSAAQEISGSEPAGVDAVVGTWFTYQGRVTQSGAPVTGSCDFRFTLWDAGTAGTQIGPALDWPGVAVDKGYFTVALDFGATPFVGDARYLEIQVDCGAGSAVLSPRAALSPAPYALALPGLRTEQNATSPNVIGGYVGNSVTPGVAGATIAGGGAFSYTNMVTDNYGTVGGGEGNLAGDNSGVPTDRRHATVGGGYYNKARGERATVGGGSDNQANDQYATVAGGYQNTASGTRTVVAGGSDNTTIGDSATIGGGDRNTASGGRSFVGGGSYNTASGSRSAIGGGERNIASGAGAVVGGGGTAGGTVFDGNEAHASASTIGGGFGNAINDLASYATIAGGEHNTASGEYAAIPGGSGNLAAARFSLAAGQRAKANHQGAFVWADSTAADFSSTAADQLSVRASGGVRLETGTAPVQVNGNTVWHAGNDGSASGLDADLLDGKHATGFWQMGGNTAGAPGVLGTTDCYPLDLRVNNARALRLEPNATSPNVIGGHSSNSVTFGVYGATIGGGGGSSMINRVTDDCGTVGGGAQNQAGDGAGVTADHTYATVGGGYGNIASGANATIGGGDSNIASKNYSTIGGGMNNTANAIVATVAGGYYNTASGEGAAVGGGELNEASGAGAVISGGGWNGSEISGNRAQAPASTIGGGFGNLIGYVAAYAAVGGGLQNTASDEYATIAGGNQNTASGPETFVGGGIGNQATVDRAIVVGGYYNTASANVAFVGGGASNIASGPYSVVPGGNSNTAAGNVSLAAGNRAKANNAGCFVWGDSTAADVACDVDNRTYFRSTGGYYIYTNSFLTSGMYLAAGGNAWNAVSNRNLKENFTPVDTADLLDRLVAIEISTWNYKSQDPAIRHVGPMADDFNALLDGLGGEGADHINSLDADGVALAAVQGLYRLTKEQQTQIDALARQNAHLEARLVALEARAAEGSHAPPTRTGSLWLALAFASLAVGVIVTRRGGWR